MKLLLTINTDTSILNIHSQKTSGGLGNPFRQGAIAMCRQVYGFFYVYSFMVGVLGSFRACRILDPVYRPSTSTARSLVTSVGSLKITVKEKAMLQHSHTQQPAKLKTLSLSVNLISFFTLQDSNRKTIAQDLTFNQVKSISEDIKDSVIKFQRMGVSA